MEVIIKGNLQMIYFHIFSIYRLMPVANIHFIKLSILSIIQTPLKSLLLFLFITLLVSSMLTSYVVKVDSSVLIATGVVVVAMVSTIIYTRKTNPKKILM